MTFSLIVINHNTASLTADCVRSIFTHQHEMALEVIVVDNASTDDSVVLLNQEFGRQIKIIKSPSNQGFAAANNLGLKEAKGEYLFFLNSDTLIKRNIFVPLVAAFTTDSTIGIIAPALLTAEGKKQLYAYGDFPRLGRLFFGKFSAPITIQEKKTASLISAGGLRFVDWVSGAALVMRREALKLVGDWDPKFFMYFEDVDLCWRAKQNGYGVAVLTTINLTHLGGKSLFTSWSRKKLYYESQEYFFRKNYGPRQALLLKILRWPYQTWIWLNN